MLYNIDMLPSNLYATRVYAEHPIGLWPIDDELSYLSLIPKSNKDLLTWGGTIEEYDFADGSVMDPPFNLDKTYKVSGSKPLNEDETEWVDGDPDPKWFMTQIESPVLFDFFADLNHTQKVFSVNAYIYHRLPVAFYDVGYIYNNGDGDVLFTERIEPGRPNEWIRLGRTFDQTFLPLGARIYIRAYFPYDVDTSFLINGVSVGQWSETLSHESTGIYPDEISESTGLPLIFNQDMYGTALHEYGPGTDTGYVFIQEHRLLAGNGGVPLVYGSGSVTTLVPSLDTGTKIPSMVVPGNGFLNASGRYNALSLEAWIRVDNKSGADRRIIGPVSSKDGIYINGSSIALVIGNKYVAHSIGEWYRPILLHVNIKNGEASVLINGERVMSMPYDAKSAKLPDNRLYNEDWIGFYAWSDVDVFEVDSVSIFPYVMHPSVAKRRFVWGQGVESPETINAAYLGTAHTVDFSCANYSVNHSYPSTARWDAGDSHNLLVTKNGVQPMDYSLPLIVAGGRTADAVIDYSSRAWTAVGGPEFISFASKSQHGSYIFFSNADKVVGTERFFYGVFGGDFDGPLFVFEHKTTGVQLRADISNGVISYKFDGTEFYSTFVSMVDQFSAGVDFQGLSREIRSFMSNPSMVELYVGGDRINTYTGRIYKVGFSNDTDADIAGYYNNGLVESHADMMDHKGHYVLRPVSSYGQYAIDIDVFGTWSESYPLSYFANDGRLDILQFNISAPSDIVECIATFDKKDKKVKTGFELPDSSGVLDLRRDLLFKEYVLQDGTTMMFDGDVSGLTLTLALNVYVRGIAAHNFALRDMSLASIGNATDMFFDMGMRGGQTITPYTKVGNYYTTDVTRPWSTYKFSTPYLYLTNDSGIRPLSDHDSRDAGLWISVNKQKDAEFNMSAMQMWAKYTDPNPPVEPIELFAIQSDLEYIKIMGVDDGTGLRLKVYAIDGNTGQDYTKLTFHQDGNLVITPFMHRQHWTSIGIDFEPLMDFSGKMGSIRLVSSCVYNNLVFYKTSSKDEQYIFAYRTWQAVKNDGTEDLTWEFWKDTFSDGNTTWDEVAKSATVSHGVSIDDIYKTYTGTNRFVVDDADSVLMLGGGTSLTISGQSVVQNEPYADTIAVLNTPKWNSYTIKPV